MTVSTQQNVPYNIREQFTVLVRYYSKPELSSQEQGRRGEGREGGERARLSFQ